MLVPLTAQTTDLLRGAPDHLLPQHLLNGLVVSAPKSPPPRPQDLKEASSWLYGGPTHTQPTKA